MGARSGGRIGRQCQFIPSADPAGDGRSGQALAPGETCTFVVPFNDRGNGVDEELYFIQETPNPYIVLTARPPSCPV